MAEAYIYDAVRTPRGKGKTDGALHEVDRLAAGDAAVLRAVRERNELDTSLVDDVVLRLRRAGRRAGLGHRPRGGARMPTTPRRSPACRSTASAPRAWRPATWRRRR